jgi:hypothetical protein
LTSIPAEWEKGGAFEANGGKFGNVYAKPAGDAELIYAKRGAQGMGFRVA